MPHSTTRDKSMPREKANHFHFFYAFRPSYLNKRTRLQGCNPRSVRWEKHFMLFKTLSYNNSMMSVKMSVQCQQVSDWHKYTLVQKRNSSPFHLQILKWPEGIQEWLMLTTLTKKSYSAVFLNSI